MKEDMMEYIPSQDRMTDKLPAYWRRQRPEDSFVQANQEVTPETDMATMIKVEEVTIGGRDGEMYSSCNYQKPRWTDGLGPLQQLRLLRLLFQGQCDCRPQYEYVQGGDSGGHRGMEQETTLGPRDHGDEDRAHCDLPDNQADAEENTERARR
eukprot:4915990-Heterocapsa_arctica.AAC.1